MSRILHLRQTARMAALGMGSGACITAVNVIRAQPIRLDNLPSSSSQQQRTAALRSRIPAQAVQQFSSGSLAGEYPSNTSMRFGSANQATSLNRPLYRHGGCSLLTHISVPGKFLCLDCLRMLLHWASVLFNC